MSKDKSGFLQVKLCLCVDKATSQCYVIGGKKCKKIAQNIEQNKNIKIQ